jgi:cold shock CspA family protein
MNTFKCNKHPDGFITPKEGSSITEDIFVHQSSVTADGYRTLVSQVRQIYKRKVNICFTNMQNTMKNRFYHFPFSHDMLLG